VGAGWLAISQCVPTRSLRQWGCCCCQGVCRQARRHRTRGSEPVASKVAGRSLNVLWNRLTVHATVAPFCRRYVRASTEVAPCVGQQQALVITSRRIQNVSPYTRPHSLRKSGGGANGDAQRVRA
jgi:hypothetical protein